MPNAEPKTQPVTLLGKQEILAADDLPTEDVTVPEWGGMVRVQGLSGTGRDEYFASLTKIRGDTAFMDNENATAKLVARCVIDAEGKPVFTQQDVAELGRKSGRALDRVHAVAQRLSGLEEDLEQLGKLLTPTLSDGSTSGSPARSPTAR